MSAGAKSWASSEAVRKVMLANKGKNTGPEMLVRKALRAAHLGGYRLHWAGAPGKPDIAYPGKRVAVFVNGCFWHLCPTCDPPIPKKHRDYWGPKLLRNRERDAEKWKALGDQGWSIVVLWEHEIRSDLPTAIERVARALKGV